MLLRMYSNRYTVYCCWDSGKHGHFLIKLNTHFPYDPVSQSQVLALPNEHTFTRKPICERF